MRIGLAFFTVTGLTALVTACQSTADWINSIQPKAVQVAQDRGRFELNCPTALAAVLNDQDVQPPMAAYRFGAVDRAVFTIGVSGCDKRATYVVICPNDGSGSCFAGDGRR